MEVTTKNFPKKMMSEESNPNVEEDLKELLKRCPVGTYEAALEFRKSKDISKVEKIGFYANEVHIYGRPSCSLFPIQ